MMCKGLCMRKRIILPLAGCIMMLFFSCKKEKKSNPALPNPPVSATTLYSDSVFYMKNTNDYFVNPVISKSGTFMSFPDGLNIDQNTGVININKSETGLKYRVSFVASGSPDTISSYVIISGINYADKIYNLAAGDSIAAPVYNANFNMAPPGGSANIFDETNGCKNAGIVIGSTNGIINLAQTVRNQGIDTGATAQVKLVYRINDASGKAPNGLEMKIYFYRTASEIPQYLTDLLIQRKGTILTSNSTVPPVIQSGRLAVNSLVTQSKAAQPARPRPPCIIVVSR